MSKEEYDKNKEALELSNGNEPLVKFSELTGIQSKLTAVSYTHLTLPTKRIV